MQVARVCALRNRTRPQTHPGQPTPFPWPLILLLPRPITPSMSGGPLRIRLPLHRVSLRRSISSMTRLFPGQASKRLSHRLLWKQPRRKFPSPSQRQCPRQRGNTPFTSRAMWPGNSKPRANRRRLRCNRMKRQRCHDSIRRQRRDRNDRSVTSGIIARSGVIGTTDTIAATGMTSRSRSINWRR